jgi:hypothetical protein
VTGAEKEGAAVSGETNTRIGTTIEVRPRYADNRPKQGWQAALVHRSPELLILRGTAQRPADLGFVQIEQSDLFTERYWFNRWYNVFTIHNASLELKGWYANICTPIHFDGAVIRYTDLDLDLWVWPDWSYVLLDEELFEERVVPSMPPSLIEKARAGLDTLIADLKAGGALFQEKLSEGD